MVFYLLIYLLMSRRLIMICREGESGEKWNGGRTERGQELMGSHLIIVAVECAAAKIFASDMRR